LGQIGTTRAFVQSKTFRVEKNIVDDQGFGNYAHGMVVQPAVQCCTCVQFAREYRERVQ